MSELDRRTFCAGTGALAGLAITGCVGCGGAPTSYHLQTSGDGSVPSADLAGPADLAGQPAGGDMAAPGCAAGGVMVNGGPAKAIAVDSAKYLSGVGYKMYLCRDADGLYCVTAVCTHMACITAFQSGDNTFYCNCHGSLFDYNGAVLPGIGPAVVPLQHFACCLDAGGNVVVDHTQTVASDWRLVVA